MSTDSISFAPAPDGSKGRTKRAAKSNPQEEAAQLRSRLVELEENAPPARHANESQASSKARFRIIIEEGRDENDTPDCFVSCNGRAYQIRRGIPVDVPPEVVHILENAVIDKAIPQKDASGNVSGYILRKYRRFPFQNLGRSVDENGKPLMDPIEPLEGG